MPVPMNSKNAFSMNFNGLEVKQKGNLYGSDPLLSSSRTSISTANKKNVEKSSSNDIGILDSDVRRQRVSSASNSNGVSVNSNGFTQNHVSKQNQTTTNGYHSVDNQDSNSTYSNSVSVSTSSCQKVSMALAYDIVFFTNSKKDYSSGWLWKLGHERQIQNEDDDKFVRTMRRTVSEISERHEVLFLAMVKKLKIDRENFGDIFISVVDDIFSDGQINWGRIITVYAFAGKIALTFGENDIGDLESLAEKVGSYVYHELGHWIEDHGGWDAFCQFFPEQTSTEERVWNGLMLTAVGLAGAAGLATFFSMKT